MKEIVNEETFRKRIEYITRQHEREIDTLKRIIKCAKKGCEEKISQVHYCYPEEYDIEVIGKNGKTIVLDVKEYKITVTNPKEDKPELVEECGIKFFTDSVKRVFSEYL